jgi:cobalt/nickel transport system permease protein
MHIPGGYLSGQTCWVTNLISGGIILSFLAKFKILKDTKKIVYYSLIAALIFALQMLNFPIASGTSGHFLGGCLAYLAAGPFIGTLIITVVLAIQSIFFNDGSILTLGANVFVMGVIGVWIPFLIHKLFPNNNKVLIISISAWFSVVISAMVCSGLIAIGGTIPFLKSLPAMVGYHALIGFGEMALTLAAYFLLINEQTAVKIKLFSSQKTILAPLGISALVLATIISPFASSFPDGMEKVVGVFRLINIPASEGSFFSMLAEYNVPFVNNAFISTGGAGFIGVSLSFICTATVIFILGNVLKNQGEVLQPSPNNL